jgi:hypothetical protein
VSRQHTWVCRCLLLQKVSLKSVLVAAMATAPGTAPAVLYVLVASVLLALMVHLRLAVHLLPRVSQWPQLQALHLVQVHWLRDLVAVEQPARGALCCTTDRVLQLLRVARPDSWTRPMSAK